MAVFDGFAVGLFAFVRGDGFLPNYEVCSGGFFLPLSASPVRDEYSDSDNYDCGSFFHIFFRMKLWENSGDWQIYVAKCCEIFLFFIIIALFLFSRIDIKIYFMVVKIYFNENQPPVLAVAEMLRRDFH